jgi:hypothetical protein
MRLHCQNQCGSMNTLCILAQSVTMEGEVYLHFWQIGAPPVLLRCSSGAPPGICLSFETGGKRAQNRKK